MDTLQKPCKAASVFDEVKGFKPPQPPTYLGAADVVVFEEHIRHVRRHFKLLGAAGPEFDQQCVDMHGLYLRGAAKLWFEEYVTGVFRLKRQWYYVDVILGLFDRFVNTTAIHQATAAFDNIQWDAATGVDGLYNAITTSVMRMIHPPDKYTQRRKFVSQLPARMQNEMVRRNALPEMCELEDLHKCARVIEHGERTLEFIKREKRVSNMPSDKVPPRLNTMQAEDESEDNPQMAAVQRDLEKGQDNGQRGGRNRPPNTPQNSKPQPWQRTWSKNPNMDKDKIQRQEDKRRPEFLRAARSEDGQDDQGNVPNTDNAAASEPDAGPNSGNDTGGDEYNSDYTIEEVSVHCHSEHDEACFRFDETSPREDEHTTEEHTTPSLADDDRDHTSADSASDRTSSEGHVADDEESISGSEYEGVWRVGLIDDTSQEDVSDVLAKKMATYVLESGLFEETLEYFAAGHDQFLSDAQKRDNMLVMRAIVQVIGWGGKYRNFLMDNRYPVATKLSPVRWPADHLSGEQLAPAAVAQHYVREGQVDPPMFSGAGVSRPVVYLVDQEKYEAFIAQSEPSLAWSPAPAHDLYPRSSLLPWHTSRDQYIHNRFLRDWQQAVDVVRTPEGQFIRARDRLSIPPTPAYGARNSRPPISRPRPPPARIDDDADMMSADAPVRNQRAAARTTPYHQPNTRRRLIFALCTRVSQTATNCT
ncbi:hypothetical protein GGX14DRAFT_580429 [Mycena pura]|uniref:Retrotransposon gag domain-containing protein n=1 Tax=Mycena pura TaxID=153505 RepID=A0AAD6XXM8_9AGAR|nr:hypothetical protein GGX14DRAFT_580429 [Mycena pura]